MKKKTQRKALETFTDLTIRVERNELKVGASINYNAREPQYAFRLDDRDPLYRFTVQVELRGVVSWPDHRWGEKFELTIYGEDSPSLAHHLTLKDVQERDENNSPKYRQYRGKHIPVYVPPRGLGHLQKERGEKRWSAWLFTPTRFASDILLLLGSGRELFLGLREQKEGRDYWIADFSLQTKDPTEE